MLLDCPTQCHPSGNPKTRRRLPVASHRCLTKGIQDGSGYRTITILGHSEVRHRLRTGANSDDDRPFHSVANDRRDSSLKSVFDPDEATMCRNIKTLYNFTPPATDDEIRASSLQFVRKLSGFARPSKTNEVAFNRAVDLVAQAAHELLASLSTTAPARDRDAEAARARVRAAERFGLHGGK